MKHLGVYLGIIIGCLSCFNAASADQAKDLEVNVINMQRTTTMIKIIIGTVIGLALFAVTICYANSVNNNSNETNSSTKKIEISTTEKKLSIEEMTQIIGNNLLYPPEQPFPKTPSDYGIDYRDVSFTTRDGVTLSGWLLNEKAEKVIIMSHFGYRANRYGYQLKYQPEGSVPYDKEIEFVNVAKRLVDAGYTVLMYDLRNHGLSGKSKLGVGTGGVDERWDVLGAVDFVASEQATSGKPVGLLSYCMGANSTINAMAQDPEAFAHAGVKAMVALQPLRNGDFLRKAGVEGEFWQAVEKHFTTYTDGISLDYPVHERAKAVIVPTRLVQARKDPNADFEFLASLYDNIPVEKEMFWLEEPTHRFDGYNWFADHPEDMLTWFNKYVPKSPKN